MKNPTAVMSFYLDIIEEVSMDDLFVVKSFPITNLIFGLNLGWQNLTTLKLFIGMELSEVFIFPENLFPSCLHFFD